jgi:hypothetical protein
MEIPQGNLLCRYLYLKQGKIPCFLFYLFSFFFYKIREQEGKTSPAQEGGLAPVGRGRIGEEKYKGEYGAKNVYTSM